jgi:phage gp29-like protein
LTARARFPLGVNNGGNWDALDTDPAFRTPGVPPNYGQYALLHPATFQGLFGTFSHVYRTSDEALNDSWDNARYMRNDPGIMECVEARQRSVALLPWHIEPENEKSHEQQELARQMTRILQRMRRFTEYRRALLEAIWYGRSAVQHRFGWVQIGDRRYVMPAAARGNPGWMPVHGDKLVWRYDDGTGRFLADQVGIRVGQKRMNESRINDRWRVEPTDRGMAYFLSDWERPLLAIHKHQIEDGAFEQPQDAGFIHGIGIRHRIYWEWFQKQEALAFLMEFLERSAGGVEVHYYPDGNEQARQSVLQAIQDRIANGHNVMMYPKPAGEDPSQYGVDFVEPGVAGIEALKELLVEYYGHRIKRYILGQTLSSEAGSTGLGSGVAELHYDTLQQILTYDANNLERMLADDIKSSEAAFFKERTTLPRELPKPAEYDPVKAFFETGNGE